MKASVEKQDCSYEVMDMGNPVCGDDFCDQCGDCLHCYAGQYCPSGEHTWVIYKDDPKNPLSEILKSDNRKER